MNGSSWHAGPGICTCSCAEQERHAQEQDTHRARPESDLLHVVSSVVSSHQPRSVRARTSFGVDHRTEDAQVLPAVIHRHGGLQPGRQGTAVVCMRCVVGCNALKEMCAGLRALSHASDAQLHKPSTCSAGGFCILICLCALSGP